MIRGDAAIQKAVGRPMTPGLLRRFAPRKLRASLDAHSASGRTSVLGALMPPRNAGWTAPDGICCAKLAGAENPARRPSLMNAITIELDIAKCVFQVHGRGRRRQDRHIEAARAKEDDDVFRQASAAPGGARGLRRVARGHGTAPKGRIHDRSSPVAEASKTPLAKRSPSIHDDCGSTDWQFVS